MMDLMRENRELEKTIEQLKTNQKFLLGIIDECHTILGGHVGTWQDRARELPELAMNLKKIIRDCIDRPKGVVPDSVYEMFPDWGK